MKVVVPKKFKNETERKQYEVKEKARELLKGKYPSKLSQAVKDELLIELCKMHDLI